MNYKEHETKPSWRNLCPPPHHHHLAAGIKPEKALNKESFFQVKHSDPDSP